MTIIPYHEKIVLINFLTKIRHLKESIPVLSSSEILVVRNQSIKISEYIDEFVVLVE